MDLHFYQTCSFILIMVFLGMFSMLDGFDLGVGMLLPFAKDKDEAGRLVSMISPFWDGNEVWLITAAGFAFAAFPAVYGLLLSSFYLPIMAFVAALVMRGLALDYSYHDLAHQRMWQRLAAGGSYGVTILGLLTLGTILQGLPFVGPGLLSQTFSDYVGVFPILFCLAGTVFVIWQGMTYTLIRDPSGVRQDMAKRIWPAVVAAGMLLMAAWGVYLPQALGKPIALMGGVLCAMGIVAGRLTLWRKGWAFYFSCVSMAGLWMLIAASLYPDVLPARHPSGLSLTLGSAAAPLSTLKPMVLIGSFLIPVILVYTGFTYRVFRKGVQ